MRVGGWVGPQLDDAGKMQGEVSIILDVYLY